MAEKYGFRGGRRRRPRPAPRARPAPRPGGVFGGNLNASPHSLARQKARAHAKTRRAAARVPAVQRAQPRVPVLAHPTPRQRAAIVHAHQRGQQAVRQETQRAGRFNAGVNRKRWERGQRRLAQQLVAGRAFDRRLGSPLGALQRASGIHGLLGKSVGTILREPGAPKPPVIPIRTRGELRQAMHGTTPLQKRYFRRTNNYIGQRLAETQQFEAARKSKDHGPSWLTRFASTLLGVGPKPAVPGTPEEQLHATVGSGLHKARNFLARQEGQQESGVGTMGPSLPGVERTGLKLARKGLLGTGHFAAGALGAVGAASSYPGRKLFKALGAGRQSQELGGIILNPLNVVGGGAGAEARGLAGATRAATRLERAGVDLSAIPRVRNLQREALASGDSTALHGYLRDIERGRVRAKKLGRLRLREPVDATNRVARAAKRGRAATKPIMRGGKEVVEPLPNSGTVAVAHAKTMQELHSGGRPGFHVQLLTPAGSEASKLLGGRRLPRLDIPLPKFAAEHIPVPKALLPGVRKFRAAHLLDQAKANTMREFAVSKGVLRAEEKAAREAGDLPRLQHVQERTAKLDSEINTALDKLPEDVGHGKMSLGEAARTRARMRAAHAAYMSGQDVERMTRTATSRQLDAAIADLRAEHSRIPGRGTGEMDAKGEKAFSESLARVQTHLFGNEGLIGGRAVLNASEKFRLTPVEERTLSNVRNVYDNLLRQGKELRFLDRGIADYAGTRLWNRHNALESLHEALDKVAGGTENMIKHREAPSAFDLANREGVAGHLQRAFPKVTEEEAKQMADNLFEHGSTRFHAQLLARRLQRGLKPTTIKMLTPHQWQAVRAWSRDQGLDNATVFESLDNPANEGHVRFIQDLEKSDRTAPFARDLSNEAIWRSLDEDLNDATHMRNLAHEQGDTVTTGEMDQVISSLNDELGGAPPPHAPPGEEPPGGGPPEPGGPGDPSEGAAVKAKFEKKLNNLANESRGNFGGLLRALDTVDPRWFDAPKNGQQVKLAVADRPEYYGTYEHGPHRVTMSTSGHDLGELSADNVARIRSTLLHELTHARTLRPGELVYETEHFTSLKPFSKQAQQDVPGGNVPEERLGSLRSQRARKLRDEAQIMAVGRDNYKNMLAIRDAAKMHVDTNGIQLASSSLDLSLHERKILRSLQTFHKSYRKSYKFYGKVNTQMIEISGRALELAAANPANFARIVGRERADWLLNDVAKVQSGMLHIPEEGAKWLDSNGTMWFGKNHEEFQAWMKKDLEKYAGAHTRATWAKQYGQALHDALPPEDPADFGAGFNRRPEGPGRASAVEPPQPGSIDQWTVPQPELAWWSKGKPELVDKALHLLASDETGQQARQLYMALRAADDNLRAGKPGTIQVLRHEIRNLHPAGLHADPAVAQEKVIEQFQQAHGLATDADALRFAPPPEGPPLAQTAEGAPPPDSAGRLPETRSGAYDKVPSFDPREIMFFRGNAQARAAGYSSMWQGYDRAVGRTRNDPTLIQRGTPAGADWSDVRWYDPKTNQEYMIPTIARTRVRNAVPEDRLWPTHAVVEANRELVRMGGVDGRDQAVESLMATGLEHLFANLRWGTTVPFPAYHIRNMVSDALKSLQADTGVMFHPLMNARLFAMAFGKRESRILRPGTKVTLNVPGVGRMASEDFLFMADMLGVRSSEHAADFGAILAQSKGKPNPNALARFAHKIQRGSLNLGAKREDTIRLMTFMQRMSRNGGDAADASWYMIRHHFDYADLSLRERKFARNLFFFYTWYRKNIPLQFQELIRRPGFFAGVGELYNASEQGDAPWNLDLSQISPILPNLKGAAPRVPGAPDFVTSQLAALPVSWNGQTTYFGFGAPWADTSLLATDRGEQLISMMNPAVSAVYQLASRREPLTGRDYRAKEPSGPANLVDFLSQQLGLGPLQRDSQGRALLPRAVHIILGSVAPFSRATQPLATLSNSYAKGGFMRTSRTLAPLTGVSTFQFDPKHSTQNKATGLFYDFQAALKDVSNQSQRARTQHARKWLRENVRTQPVAIQNELANRIVSPGHVKNITQAERRRRMFTMDRVFPTFYKRKSKKQKAQGRGGSTQPWQGGAAAPAGGGGSKQPWEN